MATLSQVWDTHDSRLASTVQLALAADPRFARAAEAPKSLYGPVELFGVTIGVMTDERWTAEHFSQANPKGPGQDDVPALLRRVADTLGKLGPITVHDLVLHTEATADGDWHSLTVYFDRATGNESSR